MASLRAHGGSLEHATPSGHDDQTDHPLRVLLVTVAFLMKLSRGSAC